MVFRTPHVFSSSIGCDHIFNVTSFYLSTIIKSLFTRFATGFYWNHKPHIWPERSAPPKHDPARHHFYHMIKGMCLIFSKTYRQASYCHSVSVSFLINLLWTYSQPYPKIKITGRVETHRRFSQADWRKRATKFGTKLANWCIDWGIFPPWTMYSYFLLQSIYFLILPPLYKLWRRRFDVKLISS